MTSNDRCCIPLCAKMVSKSRATCLGLSIVHDSMRADFDEYICKVQCPASPKCAASLVSSFPDHFRLHSHSHRAVSPFRLACCALQAHLLLQPHAPAYQHRPRTSALARRPSHLQRKPTPRLETQALLSQAMPDPTATTTSSAPCLWRTGVPCPPDSRAACSKPSNLYRPS